VDRTPSGALWYFAYGSNMSRAIFVDLRRIEPLAARPAWIDGYRLVFDIPVGKGERGVASLATEHGARTHGVLYRLTPEQGEHLDHTEGVHFGVYQRIAVEVSTAHGDRISAFTYQSSRTSEGRKPSPRYLGLLLDGAREHGLPQDYVQFLQSFELARDERSTGRHES
jgi:cation transport regulator ChaC